MSALLTPSGADARVRHDGEHRTSGKASKKQQRKHRKHRLVGRSRASRGSLGGVKPGASHARAPHGPVSSSAPAPAPATDGDEPLFGAFTHDAPYGGNVDAVDELEAGLNRRVDIVNWYQSWGGGDWVSQVQPDVIGAVTDSGRKPLLTWEPWDPAQGADQPEYRLQRLADGAYDDYIASWADALRDTGQEIYLRPMHEMNGNWYPWSGAVGGNSAALYVAAWRRMHDIFAAHGATNVRWVWCPVNYSVPNTPANALERYYPGTAYVDVLSLDGYNWGGRHEEYGGWQSFSQVFKGAYDRLTKLGPQPVWIAEVGSAPSGGDKAKWVRNMWETAARWNRLEAIVWFDQDKEEDWRALPVASAFSAA